ncbi:MAG: uL15 family ribosomal protein [Clostridia bacterium]|nr:uL15 family ribosomal protein [Clostridia bacterium]
MVRNVLSAVMEISPTVIGIIAAAAAVLIGALLAVFFLTRKKKRADKHLENFAKDAAEELTVADCAETPEEQTETEKTEEAVEAAEEVSEEPEEAVEAAGGISEKVEEAIEEKGEPESAEEPDDEKDEPDGKDDDEEDEAPIRTVARAGEHIRYIIIKYNKSFTAKLIQSADGVKDYYTEIKNEILSYKGVKARVSWKYEAFNAGRAMLAKIAVRGKNLSLFLALDPKAYADTKYIIDDMSEVAAYEKTPLLYRIKNDRRLNYCKELIATVMQANGLEKLENYENRQWGKEYPYEKIEPLIERKLVKVLTEEDAKSGDVFKPRSQVAASEVNELLQDEIAVALIEEADEISDKTKSGIINIDTLSRYFDNGETVTLEEIKKRVPDFPKKTTFIKVLARGTLDKKLKVIADGFSIEAAKMILLTGGNAVKKK